MPQPLTLTDAIHLFTTIAMPARNLAARTRTEYVADLQALAAHLSARGTTRLADVTLADLHAYQAEMERQGLGPASRRRKTYAVKTFFKFLHQHGATADDPAARLKPPRVPKREPRYLSEVEYQSLLRGCQHRPRDAAMIELFLQTGMRLSEVARLTVSSVELPPRPSPDPDNVGFAHVTRKGGRRDTIPLNYKACRALKTWLAVRPETEHDALFVSKFRTPMSKRAIQAAVATYLKGAGIDGASVHTLRHTMATHHVARGTDLKTIQETLGHADLATTVIYVQLAKRAQRRALQEHAL